MYFDLMYETARQRCVGVLTKMFEVCSLESGEHFSEGVGGQTLIE